MTRKNIGIVGLLALVGLGVFVFFNRGPVNPIKFRGPYNKDLTTSIASDFATVLHACYGEKSYITTVSDKSNSMGDVLHPDMRLLVVYAWGELGVGDIVIRDNRKSGVIHLVDHIASDGKARMKGLNNKSPDREWLTEDNYKGTVLAILPHK